MSRIRDQIAAKRAEARASPAASSRRGAAANTASRVSATPAQRSRFGDEELLEARSVDAQIKHAARNGKLDLSALELDELPIELFTDLLGIPLSNLARAASSQTPTSRGAVWVEPEELTVFKASSNRIREIDSEFGAFGGLRTLDLNQNQLSHLPDSVADLLKLTSVDLSRNCFASIPAALLLLPALQVLDLSHNSIRSIDTSSPVQPSEEGLAYGAGFLSTSFSRGQNTAPRPVWPALRSLNLGHNSLSDSGLRTLAPLNLTSMRVLNLESNEFQGELNLAECGLGKQQMPTLATLILSGNAALHDVKGGLATECKVEMEGCGIIHPSRASTKPPCDPTASNSDPVDVPALPPPPSPSMSLVYRTCPAATFHDEPLNIDFDLYLPESQGGGPRPLVIWFHGGGLLQGNKENLPAHFRRLPSFEFAGAAGKEHIAVISPNYRLAPQVPVLDILSDITALLNYVRTKLNTKLEQAGSSQRIDTNRICLSGSSAGGYLALIAGLAVPKNVSDEAVGGYRGELAGGGIKCLAPFCPITDLTDPFWSTETNPVPWWGKTVSHEAARPHLDTKASPVCTAVSGGPRSILYPYMLQHALFPSLLFLKQRSVGSGLDAFRPTPETLSITHRLRLCKAASQTGPVPQVPVYLAHGTIDDKVQPIAPAVDLLRETVPEFHFESRQGADHAFDEDPNEECIEFRTWLEKHLI